MTSPVRIHSSRSPWSTWVMSRGPNTVWVWAKASGLVINPAFERPPPPEALRGRFLAQELACFAWAVALAVLMASRVVPVRAVALGIAAMATGGIVNQFRTAVAHRFRNEGGELTFEEQFLDTVNVPGHRLLTGVWAPVRGGIRRRARARRGGPPRRRPRARRRGA